MFDMLEANQIDLLEKALSDAITDFVQITDSGSDSVVAVDADGTANGQNFITVATVEDVTGLTDEDVLVTNGNLIAAKQRL